MQLAVPLAGPALTVPMGDTPTTDAGSGQLIVAALIGIAVIVVLITVVKMHPFLALAIGSVVLAACAGISLTDLFSSFTNGLGSTVGDVGVLIVLGSMIGKFLIDSGGADAIVDTVLDHTRERALPWAMALIAFVIGIPLFFEVGIVLLIPVVMLAAKRANKPVVLLGIPALAGLSALHGLIPPHPGPLIAISGLNANLGVTLGFGILVAIPTVAIAGPLAGRVMAKWVPIKANDKLLGTSNEERDPNLRTPKFATALSVVLMPVVLMLVRTLVELLMVGQEDAVIYQIGYFIGTPIVALMITVFYAMIVLGTALGRKAGEVSDTVGASLGPIAGILLIVGAGGGFKQTLVDTGVADVIGDWIQSANIPVLLAAWLVAVAIRLATGSATVATVTAAGIMAPLAAESTTTHAALMVLAIGAGSVFLSHVNDAGFWLVKEYFSMTVGQTFKTWSLMETLLSVVALVCVLILGAIVV